MNEIISELRAALKQSEERYRLEIEEWRIKVRNLELGNRDSSSL